MSLCWLTGSQVHPKNSRTGTLLNPESLAGSAQGFFLPVSWMVAPEDFTQHLPECEILKANPKPLLQQLLCAAVFPSQMELDLRSPRAKSRALHPVPSPSCGNTLRRRQFEEKNGGKVPLVCFGFFFFCPSVFPAKRRS